MVRRTFASAVAMAALCACSGSEPGEGPALLPPVSGLDARPSNPGCIAPERDPVAVRVATPRAFPGLRFAAPIALLQAPGDGSRWFVVEQAGRIRTFANDESASATLDFVDLRARMDKGAVLGFAFHPDFTANGLAYVSYRTAAGGVLRAVTEEFSSADGGLTLDTGSGRILLSVVTPDSGRIGGHLAFGPDGFLYLGLGDGGVSAVGPADARMLTGKMLRIDVDRRIDGTPYGIPPGNPNAGNTPCGAGGIGAGPCPETFASGLRNPRHWSFDRQTGALWIADEGVGAFEAVHRVKRGGNYAAREPVARYPRRLGATTTGGVVYRGSRASTLTGRYMFADSDSGLIASLAPGEAGSYSIEPMPPADGALEVAAGPLRLSVFGEDAKGELFALDGARGDIRRLVLTATGASDGVPELLSETGCLNTAAAGAPPLLDLIPYGLNAAFWSDGAHKERWLGLPDGEVISVPDSGDWEPPAGTVLVKHFRLGARLAETRLFMRHPDGGWAGYTYQWNDAQTDATRVHGGLVTNIAGQDWIFPSEGECLFCHNAAAGFSLGLETAQLNGRYNYPQTGRTRNQIVTLNSIHALSPPIAGGVPAYADPFDPAVPLEARARSYLHTNCSLCHRPGGPTPAFMDLRHDTPLAATGACDVAPTLGDLGIADARIIAPGEAGRSELLSRLSRRDFYGMPPVASLQPDLEGVNLIRDWIESLTPVSCQ